MQELINLERLYNDHAPTLLKYLRQFTRNEADALDLFQDLFLKLARHPELLTGIRSERAFFLHLARNLAFDLARRRKTEEKYFAQFFAEAAVNTPTRMNPDAPLFHHALKKALGELPADQRTVLELKLWNSLTFKEIAAILAAPRNTVASQYRYAVKKLRDSVRSFYEGWQ